MAEQRIESPDQVTASQTLRRRGALAVLAAGAAALASKLTTNTAEATHGGGIDPTALHVDQYNTGVGETRIRNLTTSSVYTFSVESQSYNAFLAQVNSYGHGLVGVNFSNTAGFALAAGRFVSTTTTGQVFGIHVTSNYHALLAESTGTAPNITGAGGFFRSYGDSAIIAEGTGANKYAIVARHTSGPSAFGAQIIGQCYVDGSLVVTGTKSAAVPHRSGDLVRVYCVEAPESYFEDFGNGQLSRGQAQVRMDQEFADLVHTNDYDVYLTAEGDSNGLYVSSKSPTAFEIRENKGGTSSLSFSYRIVAKRKDVASPRLERIKRPAQPESPRLREVPINARPPR